MLGLPVAQIGGCSRNIQKREDNFRCKQHIKADPSIDRVHGKKKRSQCRRRFSARHGRVVIIGNRGTIEINPRDAMSREADIRGMTLFGATESDLAEIHAAISAGLENSSLRPVVGREFPLAEASRAHQAVMETAAFGKIVLIP